MFREEIGYYEQMKRVCEIRELGKHKRDSTQEGH